MQVVSVMKDDKVDRHRVRNAQEKSMGLRAGNYARESQEIGQR